MADSEKNKTMSEMDQIKPWEETPLERELGESNSYFQRMLEADSSSSPEQKQIMAKLFDRDGYIENEANNKVMQALLSINQKKMDRVTRADMKRLFPEMNLMIRQRREIRQIMEEKGWDMQTAGSFFFDSSHDFLVFIIYLKHLVEIEEALNIRLD